MTGAGEGQLVNGWLSTCMDEKILGFISEL